MVTTLERPTGTTRTQGACEDCLVCNVSDETRLKHSHQCSHPAIPDSERCKRCGHCAPHHNLGV